MSICPKSSIPKLFISILSTEELSNAAIFNNKIDPMYDPKSLNEPNNYIEFIHKRSIKSRYENVKFFIPFTLILFSLNCLKMNIFVDSTDATSCYHTLKFTVISLIDQVVRSKS